MTTDIFPDTAAAIRHFECLVCFHVDQQHISTLSDCIEAHGRSSKFVAALAAEVLTSMDQMARGAGA